MTARDIMTKNSPDDDLQVAIKLMESKQIRRLPAMDSQKTMIGMLILGDISDKVNSDLSGEVLRAVSGHHS
jgi:predicted transcriptional regulator